MVYRVTLEATQQDPGDDRVVPIIEDPSDPCPPAPLASRSTLRSYMIRRMTHTWTKIPGPALPRSSHSVSVVGSKAYIFGGCVNLDRADHREIKPRSPVDNALHVVDLKTGAYEKVEGRGDVPEQRVGHVAAVVDGEIYVFGGVCHPWPS